MSTRREQLSTAKGRRAAAIEIAHRHDIGTRALLEFVGLLEVSHRVAARTYEDLGITLEEEGMIAMASVTDE